MATINYSTLQELVSTGDMRKVCGSAKGYIPVKWDCKGYPYEGKYGVGYRVDMPNNLGFHSSRHGWTSSNQYHRVEYYVWTINN